MATLELTASKDRDGFVIYFGGKPNEVDTYTFANALVAFSDAFREINAQVNPGYALELRLEAVAEGSFKAKLKEIPKSLKGALKFGAQNLILPIFVSYLYGEVINPDKTIVTVNDDEVVIQKGHDRIIVPRGAYDRAKALPNKGAVAAHLARAISAVDDDKNVSSLGVYKDFDTDKPPAILIERADFADVRAVASRVGGRTRTVSERATITILKAVMAKSQRKWEFVWNGVKISAAIGDPVFLADLLARKYLIGSGDGLEVTLEIEQEWDDTANVWLNTGYRVAHVENYVEGVKDRPLDFGDASPEAS